MRVQLVEIAITIPSEHLQNQISRREKSGARTMCSLKNLKDVRIHWPSLPRQNLLASAVEMNRDVSAKSDLTRKRTYRLLTIFVVQEGEHLSIAAEIGGAVPSTETSDRMLVPIGFYEHHIRLCSFRRGHVFNQLRSKTLHTQILHPGKNRRATRNAPEPTEACKRRQHHGLLNSHT